MLDGNVDYTGPPVTQLNRASASRTEGRRPKIAFFLATNDLESIHAVRP